MTILYVSHEFGAVERFVERIVLVRGGDRLRRASFGPARCLARPLARPCLTSSSCGSRSARASSSACSRPRSASSSCSGDSASSATASATSRSPVSPLGYLLDLPLVLTALVVSVAGGLSIEWIRARRRTAGDQALALIFYTGIAGGVVLVSAAGALNVNLFQFLFGSILTVTRGDLAVIAALGACALAVIALLYRPSSRSSWTRKERASRGSRFPR